MADKALKSNEIMLDKKDGRVWEIDFLRGVCIILLVFDHFLVDMIMFVSKAQLSSEFGLALRKFADAYFSKGNLLGNMGNAEFEGLN